MNPYVMRRVRLAYVQVIGYIWMPSHVERSYIFQLSDSELKEIGDFTRDNISNWLAIHAGDFRVISDFCAVCGSEELNWVKEDSENKWLGMYDEEA
jgi:hypothetical protein